MTKREILQALLDGKTLVEGENKNSEFHVKYNEKLNLVWADSGRLLKDIDFIFPEQWHIVTPKVKLYASVSSQINKNDAGWTIQFHKSEKTDRIRLPQFDCEVDA